MEENKENVSIETPEFVVQKETMDELNKIEEEAINEIANSKDDSEPEKIIEKAEKAKKNALSKKPVATVTRNTIKGLKLAISGFIVGSDGKSEDYEISEIVVPEVANLVSYMKQIAFIALKKSGKRVMLEDIITYYRDDEEQVEMPADFLGKDILTFTEEEVLFAKMAYNLKHVDITNGIRSARISLYKAVCRRMGLPVPDSDENIKKWQVIKLA